MWFKNLQPYALPAHWSPSAGQIEEALAKHPLLPCMAAAMQSQGWVSPGPGASLVHAHGKQLLIALGIETKLLPASVVNQMAKDRAQQLEQQQGFPCGRRQLRELKERVADELRPRAFVRRRTVRAWLDFERHRMLVESSSPKLADELCTVLRADLGELPAVPLDTQQTPAEAMTGWLAGTRPHAALAPLDDAELRTDNAVKSTVRYVRHSLDGPELRSLLGGGKHVTRLALNWHDRLSYVLTETLAIKRVRYDVKSGDDEGGAKQNDEDSFAADFVLMTAELGAALDDLIAALGGAKPA